MQVCIFQPSKSSTQSGIKKTSLWKISSIKTDNRFIEPIMHWTSSDTTINQIDLNFSTKEQAIEFAQNKNWKFEVIEPNLKKISKKTYAENFK